MIVFNRPDGRLISGDTPGRVRNPTKQDEKTSSTKLKSVCLIDYSPHPVKLVDAKKEQIK